ncbi:hypothetical protein M6G63_09150 [Pseudomonas sp. BYT-5]|uniref:hypothetical protein n=1 Tax=Pseudomonas TaxID=286 RepID=UPI0015FFC4C3|nr:MULTISPECIES: hypothetical protein [Pseudomonas]URD44390.1 hypothetical protein M6G63_09150 [Pseudomonas sp. BYT-5]URK99726.1 hypothetical protein J5X93_09135 [Pseudomonas sp. BYT-1]
MDLSVESLSGLDKWGLAKRPSNSGSRSARSIIAYYSALWKTIAENGSLPAPVVIDSPNQGAQDKEHLKKLLVNVALKAPVNTQVILAHEEHPEDFVADKVINFVKGNKVLTADGFLKVYMPLFDYVQSARVSLLTSEDGESEDIEDTFDL